PPACRRAARAATDTGDRTRTGRSSEALHSEAWARAECAWKLLRRAASLGNHGSRRTQSKHLLTLCSAGFLACFRLFARRGGSAVAPHAGRLRQVTDQDLLRL